jgi:hypothetical protein
MATIETGIPVPTKPKAKYNPEKAKAARLKKGLKPEAQEISDAVNAFTADGESFTVTGSYRKVAMLAGRFAKVRGFSVTAAQEGSLVRVWRVALKVKKAKAA